MSGLEFILAFVTGAAAGIGAAIVKYMNIIRRYEDTIFMMLQSYADDKQIDRSECEKIIEQLKKDVCGQ